ncbi:malate synthase A [Actinomadura graeca]|uniref:malate synthase n=1 Tax=Actinomadura graeca TaxID=2750812 RepID=A0ABX8QUY5_9ACTN|nr:malate synthase [Actinomadura graeca]QXJ22547.1 malate synthase A [Actinomadura graeca]
MPTLTRHDVTITASSPPEAAELLSPEATAFVAELHRRFGARRDQLLAARHERRKALASGATLDFHEDTREIRDAAWSITPNPMVLADRRVEITGPAEPKTIIDALNSGASGFMACMAEAMTPTWDNLMTAQSALRAATRGELAYTAIDGRRWELAPERATLHVRPRGWHADEPAFLVDGAPVAGALLDAGLFLFHSARELVVRGAGPFLYLSKLESYAEAALWREVFVAVEDELGFGRGTIRATVLIETLPAAFEMDEIAFELRDHLTGLSAGRREYLFSTIKFLAEQPEFVQLDPARETTTGPFMRAYADLLVTTSHRRGAHAIAGMGAFVPDRGGPGVPAAAFERECAGRGSEAQLGYDGTWVAHPDLVPVVRAAFDAVLDGRPNQLDRDHHSPTITARDLLDLPPATCGVSAEDVRVNAAVALGYLATWLAGPVVIGNLMEDAVRAEAARTRLWQWVRHGVRTTDGVTVDRELMRSVCRKEAARLAAREDGPPRQRLEQAQKLFEQVTFSAELADFLTTPGLALVRRRMTHPTRHEGGA